MGPELRTHTLLRIPVLPVPACDRPVSGRPVLASPASGALIPDTGAPPPEWVHAALEQAPWVVIRRARAIRGLIPVGVRGRLRQQRWAAWLAPDGMVERVTPQELAARRAWRSAPGRDRTPALAALDAVARIMAAHDLASLWGPGGSVGFELASGSPSTHPGSDLDLCVQLPQPPSRALARSLHGQLAALPVRTDVLVETPAGALALAELAQDSGAYVLRTPEGPRLCKRAGAEPDPAAAAALEGSR